MNTKSIITKKELWNLPNAQIASLMNGKYVEVAMNDGSKQAILVKKILAASNPPHLFYGFLTEDNKTVSLANIESVEFK